MNAHTPEPWTLAHDGHGGICITGADGKQVGFVSSGPCQDANARLITAAPDLLTALECLVDCIETGKEPGMSIAIASIRKARG